MNEEGLSGCSHKNTRILDSRKKNEVVVRKRQCKTCGRTWTTAEIEVDNGRGGIHGIEDKIMNKYFDRLAG